MPLFKTDTITVDSETYNIRELSVGQMQEAREAGMDKASRVMAALPPAVVEMELNRQRDDETSSARYEAHDPSVLLKYGLIGWSHEEPCNDETKLALGAVAGHQVARAIFELSSVAEGEAKGSTMRPVADASLVE